MTLKDWVGYGWLKAEATSPEEIRNLLAIVQRDLKDASVSAVSDDRRFEAAFAAARTVANIALRATGHRTATQPGHHLKTIESLEFTMRTDSKLINRLKTLSRKRNTTSYDAAGSVSKQELELAIKTAIQLQRDLTKWLADSHPELLKD